MVMARLDALSRQTIRSWWLRACVLYGFVLVPCVLLARPFQEVCSSLVAASTIAALIATLFAVMRRERAGQGSLNGWDEAITFNGVAVLARMLERFKV